MVWDVYWVVELQYFSYLKDLCSVGKIAGLSQGWVTSVWCQQKGVEKKY